MDIANTNTPGFLDRFRHDTGTDGLKMYFRNKVGENIGKAAHLLNDTNLRFTSLFLLQPEIMEYGLFEQLTSRNRAALEITNEILKDSESRTHRLSSKERRTIYPVLKWMLETGWRDDGLSSDFEQVMEITAAILIKTFKDHTILPAVAEMVFNRFRKGLFIYDLVWAFFEARDPNSLTLIANHLGSAHRKDIELVHKLLGFIPCMRSNTYTDRRQQYDRCLHWLEENHPFLYYTGESFHQTPTPAPYAVSLEAKYLCKAVTVDTGKTLWPLTKDERELLERFNKLRHDARELLSTCSFILYRQNIYRWNVWLHYPVVQQIRVAGAMIGGWS